MEASLAQVGKVFKNVSKSLKEQAQEFMSNDSPLEKQLKEATANTNWGCANSILGQIARSTFDYHDYNVVMRHVWEALAAKPKYWRKIFKALTLLEYLVRHGPERVIDEVRDCLYRLRALSEFHHTDEGRDRGSGVRDKVKLITDLVSDTELLRSEREKARQNRDRYVGIGGHGEMTGNFGDFTGYNNTDYSYSSGSKYSSYPGAGQAGLKSIESGQNADAEREQNRVASAREKARKEREKQKEKSLKQKSSKDIITKRKSKKNETTSVESSSSSASSSSFESDSSVSSRRNKSSYTKRRTNDLFNTDVGWISGSTQSNGQGFASGFDAFSNFKPPAAATLSVQQSQATSALPLFQQSQTTPMMPQYSTAVAYNQPSSVQSTSSLSSLHFLSSHSTPVTAIQQSQYPTFFPIPTASTPSFPSADLGMPIAQSQFSLQPTVNPQRSQQPSPLQSLMAQNLANLSSMGPPSQPSRNPFGSNPQSQSSYII